MDTRNGKSVSRVLCHLCAKTARGKFVCARTRVCVCACVCAFADPGTLGVLNQEPRPLIKKRSVCLFLNPRAEFVRNKSAAFIAKTMRRTFCSQETSPYNTTMQN